MAHTYTPVPTGSVLALTLPDDGDASNAASVNAPIAAVADAAADRLSKANGGTVVGPAIFQNITAQSYGLSSTEVYRTIDGTGLPLSSAFGVDTSGWIVSASTLSRKTNTSGFAGVQWYWEAKLPDACILRSVLLSILPAAGHGASMPVGADMPTIQVYKKSVGSMTPVAVLTHVDTTTPAASYETLHQIGGTFADVTWDGEADTLVILFTSEAGVNALGGLQIGQPQVSIECGTLGVP